MNSSADKGDGNSRAGNEGHDSRVITVLRDRFQIEQEIRSLLRARSEDDLSRRARRVAARGSQVIPVIVNGLESSDSRLLGALGVVASYYPQREQLLNKLYQIAADAERSDKSRLSAMLIMERFLDQEPDPYLVGTLNDPRLMAIESIRDMLREGKRDPAVLVDYVRALDSQSGEMFAEVIDTLLEVGQEDAVPVLCLLAQEPDDSLSEIALGALGRLSHPHAIRGLQSLCPMLPPDRRALCERQRLKLHMKGVPSAPLPAPDGRWRALVGPVDGEGSRVVWMVTHPDEGGESSFVGVSISESQGIVQAYGRHRVPARLFPERQPFGHVHTVSLGRSAGDTGGAAAENMLLYMVETEFDYGRRLIRQGQSLSQEQGRLLPVEYRLLGALLWQYDDAGIDDSPWVSDLQELGQERLWDTPRLLSHPGFEGWFARGQVVFEHAQAMLQWMPVVFLEGITTEAVALAQEVYDRAALDRLQRRVEAMAEWLWQAQETELARLARLVARTLHVVPPAEHPFTLRMAELGLNLFVEQVQIQVGSNQ